MIMKESTLRFQENSRMTIFNNAPISFKGRDIIMGAESYLYDLEQFDFIVWSSPCFPKICPNLFDKVNIVWNCHHASWALQNNRTINKSDDHLLSRASEIYQQEALRILCSIFHIDHKFWHVFYRHQESSDCRLLPALDALHFATDQSIHID